MFNEEEAFWHLVMLIDEILPAHYYEGDLRGIRAETELFAMIVAKEVFFFFPPRFFSEWSERMRMLMWL